MGTGTPYHAWDAALGPPPLAASPGAAGRPGRLAREVQDAADRRRKVVMVGRRRADRHVRVRPVRVRIVLPARHQHAGRLLEPLAFLNIQLGYGLEMGTQIGFKLLHG